MIVNDGSNDKTEKILSKMSINYISHRLNLGLGAAIKTAVNFGLNNDFTHMVMLDGDGQHPTYLIEKFIKKLDSYDFVIRNRFHNLCNVPFPKLSSNFLASFILYKSFGIRMKDVSCGFRAFKIEEDLLKFSSNRYDFIFEQNIYIKKQIYTIGYIDIPVIYYFDELLATKYEEILSFFNLILAYEIDIKNKDIVKKIFDALNKIKSKNNFVFTYKKIDIFGFYLDEYNSYIIQTNYNFAKKYFESIIKNKIKGYI